MRTGSATTHVQKLDPMAAVEYWERTIANGHLCRLSAYLIDPNSRLILTHKIYIDTLFSIEDFLYDHGQDITAKAADAVYFSLLDYAINSLRILHASEEELVDYLEKAAVTFQTAADRTRMEPEHDRQIYQEIWKRKAQQYSQEAFKIRYKVEQDISHETQMLQLYQQFAERDGFAQKFLRHRYCEYKAKYEMGDEAASEPSTGKEPSLRHRHGFQFGNADSSDPSSAPLLPTAIESKARY